MEHWLEMISPRPRSGSTSDRQVQCTGETGADADYLEPLRTIYDHELIIYDVGGFEVEFEGGQVVACEADSFIILPPGRLHIERNAEGRSAHRQWCHFDWVYQPDYERTPVVTFAPGKPAYHLCRTAPEFVPACPLHGPLPDPPAARAQLRQIAGLLALGSEAARLEARVVLLQLLIGLLADAPAVPTGGSLEQGLASQIRRTLDQVAHLETQTLSLPAVLAESGFSFSYAHMCRVFSSTYGLAPLQYVQAVRIARAQVLLRSTALTVAEIGYRVGFNGPAYFGKIFRRHTGQRPLDYRRDNSR